jgi:hypothetical protein
MTQYGTTFIEVFIDDQDRIFKYMGSNPVVYDQNEWLEGFRPIAATIKHSEYNGIKESKLLRIKVK